MSGFPRKLAFLDKWLHKFIKPGENHIIHNWTYADATTRGAATGFVGTDLYKLALQQSDNSLWLLTGINPATWVQVGTGATGGSGGGGSGGSAGQSFVGFSATVNAAQAIPANTATKITYTVEDYDIGGYYDNTTSRFNPKVPGYYLFKASVFFSATSTVEKSIKLLKNGTDSHILDDVTSSAYMIEGSKTLYMNGTTDYVEAWVYNASAANTVANPYQCFQGFLTGATGGASGNVNITPDTPPSVPNVADDEFTGAALDTTGTRAAGATPWSWANQATASSVLANGSLVMTIPAVGVTDNWRFITQPVSGAGWKYRTKLVSQTGVGSNFTFHGIAVRNSVSGKHFFFGIIWDTTWKLAASRWNSPTSWNANMNNVDIFSTDKRPVRSPLYLEIELSGTNIIFRYSDSGVEGSFITHYTEPIATFLTSVDQIGFAGNSPNNFTVVTVYDWFRRIS